MRAVGVGAEQHMKLFHIIYEENMFNSYQCIMYVMYALHQQPAVYIYS